MNTKHITIPGPDHPITITPTKGRVTVTVNGIRMVDTHEDLTLKEAAYPAERCCACERASSTSIESSTA